MITDLYKLPALKSMENLARGRSDVISLSQGIPWLPSDDSVRLAVIDAMLKGKVDMYSEPQGLLSLRTLISQKLNDEGMEYEPQEIIVTAGAIEALSTTLLYLGKNGGEILIPTPTYASYLKSATVAGLKIRTVQLTEEKGWNVGIADIKKQLTPQTKALLLCNPNNPTGNVYDEKTLNELCELAIERNFQLILDEVYGNIHWQNGNIYTPAVKRKNKKNIIRIVSFSKDFALTGWRVGFLHTDETTIKKLLPYHDTLVNCAPVISQYAAFACLLHEQRIRSYTLDAYTRQRALMGDTLETLHNHLSFFYPQGSYFFFPKIHCVKDDVAFCLKLIDKAKIAVVPGSDFGPGGEGHIRLCFGRDPKDIEEGMKRLTNYFNNKV